MLKALIIVTAFAMGIAGQEQKILDSEMAAQKTDTIMGEYQGLFTSAEGDVCHAEADVVALGKGEYKAVLAASTEPALNIELVRDTEVAGVSLFSPSEAGEWNGKIENGVLVAESNSGKAEAFKLLRVERHSPTEGLKPLPGAVVLLPFEKGKKTSLDEWTNKKWEALPDGSVRLTRGHNRTVREHGSGLFHIEFKTPYEPAGRGQGRGNSGVYFESRYEIQILDSFGLVPGMGDCGSIYSIAITKENACFPPLSWQTYDVIFVAPHENAEGKLEPALMTVFHNGVKIHENQPVPHTTTAAPEKKNAVQGPLFLQDHGHAVCYRNIWYLPVPN